MYIIKSSTRRALLSVTPGELCGRDAAKVSGIYIGNGCMFASDSIIAAIILDDTIPEGWWFLPADELATDDEDVEVIFEESKFICGVHTHKILRPPIDFDGIMSLFNNRKFEKGRNENAPVQLQFIGKLDDFAKHMEFSELSSITQLNDVSYVVTWSEVDYAIGVISSHTVPTKPDDILTKVTSLLGNTGLF